MSACVKIENCPKGQCPVYLFSVVLIRSRLIWSKLKFMLLKYSHFGLLLSTAATSGTSLAIVATTLSNTPTFSTRDSIRLYSLTIDVLTYFSLAIG